MLIFFREGGLHDRLVGMPQGFRVKVAALMSKACHVIGVIKVIKGALIVDQVGGIFNSEGVDIVGEGGTVMTVESVDNLVLGDMEVVGKEEDREVGVEVGFGVFDIFGQLTAEECQVAPRLHIQTFPTLVEDLDTDRGTEGAVADKEHDDGLHDGADGSAPNGARGVEGIHDVAEYDEEAVEGDEKVGAQEVGAVDTVSRVVLVEQTAETIDAKNAVYTDKGCLGDEKNPIEVEVDRDDDVVAPAIVEEAMGDAFAAALNPEAIHVVAADNYGCRHENDNDHCRDAEEVGARQQRTLFFSAGQIGDCCMNEGRSEHGKYHEHDNQQILAF